MPNSSSSSLVTLDGAQITRSSSGYVVVDDPKSWLLVFVRVSDTPPTRVTELVVRARHPSARITPSALARLPLAQIAAVSSRQAGSNESLWQLSTTGRTGRRWDDSHWGEVLAVYDWAVATGRDGGPYRAVADLWNVTVAPTAYRWVAEARRRASA